MIFMMRLAASLFPLLAFSAGKDANVKLSSSRNSYFI